MLTDSLSHRAFILLPASVAFYFGRTFFRVEVAEAHGWRFLMQWGTEKITKRM